MPDCSMITLPFLIFGGVSCVAPWIVPPHDRRGAQSCVADGRARDLSHVADERGKAGGTLKSMVLVVRPNVYLGRLLYDCSCLALLIWWALEGWIQKG